MLNEVFQKANAIQFISAREWKEKNAPNDIVVYCVGTVGINLIHTLSEIGLRPAACSDSNQSKWGKKIAGIEVIPPKEIVKRCHNPKVIIALLHSFKRHFPVITESLRALGVAEIIHHSELRCISELQGKNLIFTSYTDILPVLEHEKEIDMLYDYMSDDISKQMLRSYLFERIGFMSSFELSAQGIYFDESIYSKHEREVFIDCGAYDGDTLESFLSRYTDFTAYWAIEPDESNVIRLKKKMEDLSVDISAIHVISKAVSDICGELSFMSGEGTGSHISDQGIVKVLSVTLDSVLRKQVPTVIKMDIEGAEQRALDGACEIIQTYRPVLAICVYHYPRDLWEIPLWIKERFPFYHLYLRAYDDGDVVCYAVPTERLAIKGDAK